MQQTNASFFTSPCNRKALSINYSQCHMLIYIKDYTETMGLQYLRGPHPPPNIPRSKYARFTPNKNMKITIEANKNVVNYSDMTLDLNTEKQYPFMKLRNVPPYVHTKNNHPLSDKEAFNKAALMYQAAPDKSGYT